MYTGLSCSVADLLGYLLVENASLTAKARLLDQLVASADEAAVSLLCVVALASGDA